MDEKIRQLLPALLLSTGVFERGLGMKKFAILGMLAALLSSTAYAAEETSCKVTKAQSDSIKKDMTYESIVATVGCEGVVIQWGPNSATPWQVRYRWSGNGGEKSYFTAQFYQDHLNGKTDSHLQ